MQWLYIDKNSSFKTRFWIFVIKWAFSNFKDTGKQQTYCSETLRKFFQNNENRSGQLQKHDWTFAHFLCGKKLMRKFHIMTVNILIKISVYILKFYSQISSLKTWVFIDLQPLSNYYVTHCVLGDTLFLYLV